MIDNWINEGSGWIIELIESQYINISTYRPLSGSSYMNLPVQLRSPWKELIDIKNKDKKCFSWCHVRHINYDEIEFPIQEKDFNKTEVKNNICINVFGYENRLVFLIYISEKKFKDSMDLLLLTDKESYLSINGKQSVKL